MHFLVLSLADETKRSIGNYSSYKKSKKTFHYIWYSPGLGLFASRHVASVRTSFWVFSAGGCFCSFWGWIWRNSFGPWLIRVTTSRAGSKINKKDLNPVSTAVNQNWTNAAQTAKIFRWIQSFRPFPVSFAAVLWDVKSRSPKKGRVPWHFEKCLSFNLKDYFSDNFRATSLIDRINNATKGGIFRESLRRRHVTIIFYLKRK